MKYPPKVVGLLQALGLTAYICTFALVAQSVELLFPKPEPIFAIIVMLLAFVISALISATLILGYPILLFFNNKKKEAVETVVWSAVYLVIIFTILLVGLLF